MRSSQRKHTEMRPVQFDLGYTIHAEGSVLVSFGNTKVLCTASIEETVPRWLQGRGSGWITAEYGMLPRSTHTRMQRDKAATGGRTQEISRLVARSLRAAVDLNALGERMLTVDCDVIQADGGTRTAAISGGYVALALACSRLVEVGLLASLPLKTAVAAVSVGLDKEGAVLLDLDYEEDSKIFTDMNVVMNDKLEFIELQGTAESGSFSFNQLNAILESAKIGCERIFAEQQRVLNANK